MTLRPWLQRALIRGAIAIAALCAPPPIPYSSLASAGESLSERELSNWSGGRAMQHIALQLSFGARAPGAPGHDKAVAWIKQELAKNLATVLTQEGILRDLDGAERRVVNIIGRFDADNPRRIIIGTHYDSIVRAYADRRNPKGPMPGANNSASGVALLIETARTLRALGRRPDIGLDLVFFDGEEGPLSLGAGDPNWRALGSPYFASRLAELYPEAHPVGGVIFDMVCYKKLKLQPEPISLRYARVETERFWSIGQQIAPSIFLSHVTPAPILDDQTALAGAGIPSFLVIGFQYDPWFNTTQDTIDKCSASSLEAVGRTLLRYVFELEGR